MLQRPRRKFALSLLALGLNLTILSGAGFAASNDIEAARLAADSERYLRAAERYPEPDSPGQMRHYRKAESLAEKALELDDHNATAHFVYFAARGRRLISEGGIAATLKMTSLNAHLTTALELDPNYANALAAKGGILLDLPFYLGGDAEEAQRYLKKAVNLNPTGPGTRITYAKALIRTGQKEDARKHLTYAAHYACVTRRAEVLSQATTLLAELE